MLTFYRGNAAVVCWHVINQSFNGLLNYVNRNTSSPMTDEQLAVSYVVATGSATSVALGLNRAVSAYPALAAGLLGRLVPFTAVAAANLINMPLMRRQELTAGIVVEDATGRPIQSADEVGGTAGSLSAEPIKSTAAARWAIGTSVFSRIAMAVPGMVVPPLMISQLNRRTNFLRRFPRAELPLQLLFSGLGVALAVPLACAIFPQRSSLAVVDLEPEAQRRLQAVGHAGPVYFNKGL